MAVMDDLIRLHFQAAADVVQAALADAVASDPAGAAILAKVVRAGGILTLRTAVAPSAGLASLAIEVVEPGGQAHQLLSCELKRETFQ